MNIKNFKEKISPVVYQKGEEYFINGLVSELELSVDNRWLSTVEGSEDYNIAVELDLKGNIVDYDCNCPYDGEICKHVVATLLKIKNDWDSEIKQDKKDKTPKDWQEMVSKVPNAELMNFVIEYAKTHKGFKNDLKIKFAEYDQVPNPEKYKKIIRDAFRNAEGRDGYINYSDVSYALEPVDNLIKKANNFRENGNFNEAFLILSAIPPECIKMMEYIDDSNGECGEAIIGAFNKIFELYKSCNDPKLKEEIVKYLLNGADNSDYNDYGCADDLMSSLLELADNPENIEALHQFFDKKIQDAERKEGWSKEYSQQENLDLKAKLFEICGENDKADLIINQNLHLSKFRQKLVDKKVSTNNLSEAIKLLEDAIEIAKQKNESGTQNSWTEQLLSIYQNQKDIENIRKYSSILYFNDRYSLKHYGIFKQTWETEKWPDERQKIIAALKNQEKKSQYGNNFNHYLADLYVEEKMDDELYLMVEKSPMINILMSYAKHLKAKYSVELIVFFKSAIEWYIDKNTGRNAYKTAAGYFKEMAKLNGGKEMVNTMINNFKLQYKNRPAMIDEFRIAGIN